MKMSQEDECIKQIKQALDESVEQLDEDTRYQLQCRRAEVLQKEHKTQFTWLKLAGACAVFALVSILWLNTKVTLPEQPERQLSAQTIFFDEEANIELYQEYDFYVWLSEQDSNS